MWKFIFEEPVILASGSPRRIELLRKAGLNFRVKAVRIDETIDTDLSLENGLMELSLRKARAAAEGEKTGWIIAADTIVSIEGENIGKPADEAEAARILRQLSGRTHRVITGFAILSVSDGKYKTGFEVTKVTFHDLTASDISDYIESKEPLDKAGSYGIQALGGLLVKQIEGCYFNVVGLPLSNFRRIWRDFKHDLTYGEK